MPCKIQIKQNLTTTIEQKTDRGTSMSLFNAQKLAKRVNSEYKTEVVRFRKAGDFVDRQIDISDALVDKYYEFEKQLEIADARSAQEKDAERAGVNYSDDYLFQVEGTEGSVAPKETIEKIKEVATKMGVSITTLSDYMKGNPNVPKSGINAITDLFKGVIAIATGKEGHAITEEVVHVATAILEQTNPEIITTLISQINKFKIYKRTLDEYKGKKAYQLANGKPNIRKIKKEAVDKLIAELIIQESPDVEANPRLTELTVIEQIKQWWRDILSAIKGHYIASNIDLFTDVAQGVLDGNISGTVKDIKNKDIYYQLEENSIVNKIFNSIATKAKDIVLHPAVPGGKKRHYTYKGKEIDISVTEKIKKNVNMPERTGIDKFLDEQKRDWGSEGHEFLANYVLKNLLDENGYARPNFLNEAIETKLPKKAQEIITRFAKELISSYPEGTRFLIENKVVNENAPETVASAIDFLAIKPVMKNGQPDAEVEVLDWKFTSFDPSLQDDIPWYKQKEWKQQMGEYSKMLTQYGVKSSQVKKARMIPFIMDYRLKTKNKPEDGLEIRSMEIGNLNNLKETKLYLLPVALDSESTGIDVIDNLVSGLRAEWNKIYERLTPEEDKPLKAIELNEMAKAIRLLHMRLDFAPLLGVSETFLKNAKKVIDSFAGVDYSKLSEEELRAKLKDLKEVKNSADKYDLLANAFKLVMDESNKDHKKILNRLSAIDTSVETLQRKITELQGDFSVQLGFLTGLTTETTKAEVLAPEKPIDKLSYSFLEASKLPAQLIKMGANMIMRVKNEVNITYNQKMNEFRKILIPLEKIAASKGKKAFDLIATKTDKGLNLVKKLDNEFIKEVQDAKAKKDKDFFREHMDKAKYEKLLAETLKENEEAIMSRTWYPLDEKADTERKQYEIRRLRNRLDISRENFNGWKTGHFAYLFYNSINEEEHYSPAFKEIKSNPDVYKAWKFFTDLNEEAQKMGYLGKHSLSFFPLIEATSIEKMAQTDNAFKQGKDLFEDLYKVRINEAQNYSKIDPETGRVKKSIPKYYTATDKHINQLSTNLDMVGSMWIKAILDYKASRNLEYSLLTLHDVEKAKGNLAMDKGGNIVFQGDKPIREKDSTRNADVFEAIIDDAVYFIREDLNSWGAQKVSTLAGVGTASEEKAEQRAVSAKKGIRTADILFRSLAIGLKPLIGLANYFGLQFQSFINAGTFYKFREFEKNNMLVTSNLLSKENKALLHLIMPLNEDIVAEKRRDIAREKGSVMKWLSTWTFTDVMMSTNSFPERLLQYANAVSMNENSMIADGKIVNIRQHLAEQDRAVKYNMSVSERRALEKSFESRVKQLKETKSLPKVVKIVDGEISLPGIDNKALAEHRLSTVEYGRKLSGLMSEDNKMGYRRDTIVSSFMMFKSWIPKHVGTRMHGINKNLELNQWEYGKTRLFTKVLLTLGLRNIGKIQDIISGNEKGLAFMQEMLEKKRIAYFNATGKELTISEEEFYDLVRTELRNQMKELAVLVSITAVALKFAAMEPPEDASDYEKNQYKWFAKLFNKTADEIQFYYNPASFDAFTKGSIMPSLNLLLKVKRAFGQLAKETKGYIIDDQELIDGAHPTKYFLNLVPGASQFQNEVLPYFYPEIAKEMGIRVTKENRQR